MLLSSIEVTLNPFEMTLHYIKILVDSIEIILNPTQHTVNSTAIITQLH